MYTKTLFTAALAVLVTSVTANPVDSPDKASSAPKSTSTCETSPPPPGETYVKGFPVCSVKGFTEVPGCYVQTTHQQSGATLKGCRDDCLHNSTCKSFAYSKHYTQCLFYDHVVEDIQLYKDDSSYWAHYDLCCVV